MAGELGPMADLGELGRPVLDELPLLLSVNGFRMDREALGESAVLRKLAEPSGAVRLTDPVMLAAIERLAALPTDVYELQAWAAAADMLCATPAHELVFAATSRSLRPFLQPLQPIQTQQDLRIVNRSFLLRSLSAPVMARQESSTPPPPQRGEDAAAPRPTPGLAYQLLQAAATIWPLAGGAGPCDTRSLLRSALLGLGETADTAQIVFTATLLLQTFLSVEELRWLAHRASLCLYAVETRKVAFFVAPEYVLAMRDSYVRGTFSLNTLLPLASPTPSQMHRRPLFLLPGTLGRQHLPVLEFTGLRERCEVLLPWLGELWRACPVYLTGSTLTKLLLPTAPVVPSDVDLFVVEDLEAAHSALHFALRHFEVQSVRVSNKKFRIHVRIGEENVYIDLYQHPLARLTAYHLSVCRVAFDGEHLLVCPSAAVALATMVSVDFTMNAMTTKAASVLARRWSTGLSLLVSYRELFALADKAPELNLPPELMAEVSRFSPEHQIFTRRRRELDEGVLAIATRMRY